MKQIALFLLAVGILQTIATAAEVRDLRCEDVSEPLAIDTPRPQLSWLISSDHRGACQTARQILVASSPDLLAKDQGDLWDSGKVSSDQSIHIAYGGTALTSHMRCTWKVRIWDGDGNASAWSAAGFMVDGADEAGGLAGEMDHGIQMVLAGQTAAGGIQGRRGRLGGCGSRFGSSH